MVNTVNTTKKKKKMGIMGGTFDPIHYGHLVTAEVARVRFRLDEVIFIPAGLPPHKQKLHVTEPRHRYNMTMMATGTNPYFTVSGMELDRIGPSYTYDTVNSLQNAAAAKGEELEIFFITGADAILEIMEWHRIHELAQKCIFIAATRPGYVLEDLKINSSLQQKIYFLEVPALAISSTDIRRRIHEGEPIKYLVPEEVENYIYKYRLYC